ncbi:MAG: transposase [Anaerolineae bacterium]|nr:transposase [Anaerolineae bacterium]MCO5190978.1 transposase [Anaerolineae bacterium]MCO5193080.1 transposase [Anaerolineae bacterium]MCO5206206.1 transposase [Anaerolineae bacterium]
MSRKFRTADYEQTLNLQITLGDALPPDHLARFLVDTGAQLDLSAIYKKYSDQGAPPYAPEVLLVLLFYGYATGVFSSRKIERATYEVIPFRFIAGNMHPDHDTIDHFRRQNLGELQELFVQILLLAQAMGVLQLGNISLDGSKIHADASKSKAVSYKRLVAVEAYLQQQVAQLLALAEMADQTVLPEKMAIDDEIKWRQQRLERLAEAKKVLEERAQARYEAEKAEYEAQLRQREAKAARKGQKPRGRKPKPPRSGPRDKDQYNFTDPDSAIMKNPNNKGFDQHYNVQVAVDQTSLLIVAAGLSNCPTDRQQALPTVDAIPAVLGTPPAAALDAGYWSEANVNGLQARGVDPYIATGREPHNQSWQAYFAQQGDPPVADAPALEKMAYRLRTDIGRAIYRLRKCTVEPVIGIIKEVLGFRQFSLRGQTTAAGEWLLVCMAFNLKRLHTLQVGL